MRMRQRAALVLSLACLLGSSSATLRAEAAPESAAKAEEPKEATDDAKARAEQLFIEGMDLYDAKTYATALERFRSSYELVKSPNSRLMMARSLRGLGSLGAAFQMYELALQDAEVAASDNARYADTAAAAREELAELRPAVGMVVVEIPGGAPPDTTLSVGGIPVERELWNRPIAVTPGKAEIVLDADGRLPARESVVVEPGKSQRLSLELPPSGEEEAKPVAPPADDSKRSLRTGAYVAGGVGLAGLITFGLGVSSDASAVSVLGIVAASLGIGAGVTLYVLSEEDDDEKPKVAIGIGPGSVELRGRF